MTDLTSDVEALRTWASVRQDARQKQAAAERAAYSLRYIAQNMADAGLGDEAGPLWDAVSNLEFKVEQIEEALQLSVNPPRRDPLRVA